MECYGLPWAVGAICSRRPKYFPGRRACNTVNSEAQKDCQQTKGFHAEVKKSSVLRPAAICVSKNKIGNWKESTPANGATPTKICCHAVADHHMYNIMNFRCTGCGYSPTGQSHIINAYSRECCWPGVHIDPTDCPAMARPMRSLHQAPPIYECLSQRRIAADPERNKTPGCHCQNRLTAFNSTQLQIG